MIMQPANGWFPEQLVTTSRTDNDRNAEHNQNFHHSENLKCHTPEKIFSFCTALSISLTTQLR